MMRKYQIPLEKTGHFSKLFLDYVNQDEKLRSFYDYSPSIESFSVAIKDISSQKFNRKLLVDILIEQYSKTNNCQLPIASRWLSGCQLLLKENTFTVCTGHQLCLFTGPLYFIYKIISTINLAEQLKKKYSENNFVPVYWMASEDHDFEEVNHVHLFGKKIEWKNKQGGALGHYLNDGISDLIGELKAILGDSKNADALIELFQNAYTKHPDFSSATRFLVNELFGEYGLVIIEPNDKRLKQEFVSIIEEDVFNNASSNCVEKSNKELQKVGYKIQVNPREINIFYIIDNQRNRIIKEDDKFKVINTDKTFSEEELKKEIKCYPERFSPNVVTRSLYQQKILPNLAYIGGPAELAYWLEYKEMFKHYGILFPVLFPRNFGMIVDAPISEKLTKLALVSEDVFLSADEMTKKFITSISGEKISLEDEKEYVRKVYKEISEKAALVDSTLVSSVNADLHRHLKEIDDLEKKMLRAFKQKNETAVNQIEKIKSKLFPDGALQERYDNFIPFYLKYGKKFIADLKQTLNPLDFSFNILHGNE